LLCVILTKTEIDLKFFATLSNIKNYENMLKSSRFVTRTRMEQGQSYINGRSTGNYVNQFSQAI